jgi:multidrug transporter EmrE-like cation transporter
MNQTPLSAILLMLTAAVLGAVGQYMYKTGTLQAGEARWSWLWNPWILAGMACYLAVMFLFTRAFRAGGAVTVLYPVYASTFIWAALIALVFYGQPIRSVHVLGMALLIAGIYLMGVGNIR